MILVIDNYDSFVHNLARYFRQLGQTTQVYRNDAITTQFISEMAPAAIVISPGPCTPATAGVSLDVVAKFSGKIPVFGVCLGHQAIVESFGGRVTGSGMPMHGRSSLVTHRQTDLFSGIPETFTVGRYHSLIADPIALPDCLRATAFSSDGVIMAVEHQSANVVGVQFHPESVLTEHGHRLIGNFLSRCGIEADAGAER